MKKWEKGVILGLGFLALVISIGVIVLLFYRDNISKNMFGLLFKCAQIILWIILVVWQIYYLFKAVILFRRCWHNIQEFEDEPFKIIDQYKKCWRESNNHYMRQIQIINLYYEENGKVDELVKKREIKKLYARADYLESQSKLYEYLITCLVSVAISLGVSLLCPLLEMDSWVSGIAFIIVLVVFFAFLCVFRYAERGQAGSYKYMVQEYELKRILEKIEKLEKSIQITRDDEMQLETQRIAIEALLDIVRKKEKKKNKEQLIKDIECIESLNLCLGNYLDCYKRKIYVNGKVGYLMYEKERGRENNWMGNQNLKTEDYSALFEILQKYNLITYDIGKEAE